MRLQLMDYLCCPACNSSLKLSIKKELDTEVIQGVLECCECKRCFEITDGLPNLNFPERLESSDLDEQMFYDHGAQIYDLRMRWSGLKLGIWEAAFRQTRSRQRLVNLLELRKGASVLDTGTGTGIALLSIAKRIGREGQVHGSDISSGMLKVAQKKTKAKRLQADLLQANASYLPYRTAVFDAALHIGGLNTFADKKRAIDEMVRVVKPGSKVVICDEGLAPGKEKTLRGRLILKRDRLYACKPPIELIPDGVEDPKVYWTWHDFYWVVEFRKKR
jgi:ubiquinone/menaquinone biosynthesis C-methylase UbiE